MTAPILHADGIRDDTLALIAISKRQPVVWEGREQILDREPRGRGIRFCVAGSRKAV